MCVRRTGSQRAPTRDDLDYHLSTLFPPVRPQGHLELRVIDAQPADGWIVPAAVVAALLDDPVAADLAMAAAEPVWHGRDRGSWGNGSAADSPSPWPDAARLGPADRVLARAGQACFEAAEAALSRADAPPLVRHAVTTFADRYISRGRCPADDMLEEIR